MGLKETFQNIPGDVFDSMGDVVYDAILLQYDLDYIPGGQVDSVAIEYPVRIIIDTITDIDILQGVAKSGDRVFLTPANELSTIPETEDSIVLDGVVWNIYQVDTDPATALWTLSARQ
jgi:hypothetical protein